MEQLLTTEDVAEWLRVDVVTVRRLVSRGDLTAYRVGGEYRFKRLDLEEYLERQRVPALREVKVKGIRRFFVPPGSLVSLAKGGASEAFERFNERARRVLVLAQEEAERMGHGYIGTEHFLLGLLREREGIAAHILGELGVTLEGARAVIERELAGMATKGEQPKEGERPLTARAKRVLELAVAEAQRLGQETIGTEHLLLGLIREGKGVGAKTLIELRGEPEAVRRAVERELKEE